MTRNIVLVGNPNTGKTTLFNTLTKSNQKVSNWHGVTVDSITKKAKYKNETLLITDLPGIYSLDPYSNEEKIAVEELKKHKKDLIINICDANNLKRNLKLTCELINSGYYVVLAINMYQECKNCNYKNLEEVLHCPVMLIDARKKETKSQFFNIFNNYALNNKMQNNNKIIINYSKIAKNENIFTKNTYIQNGKNKIDKLILNKIFFIPFFAIIIFLVFYFTFGPIGLFFTNYINMLFNKSANFIKFLIKNANISLIFANFINEAIIDSLFSILSFLPQILLLMFFINIIEDSGLMSRFAFMFDGFLKKIGLTGKSLFSLISGFGCSTSAIITTKNLENKTLQKSTISALSFLPCSAKLPILLVITSLFFEKYKYFFVFALYVFAIIISILVAYFRRKYNNKQDVFILEIPKYRIPNIKKIIRDIFEIIKDFLNKTSKMILFFSIIIWILQNFSMRLIYLNGENFNKSILYFIASKIQFLFIPIGLENVGIIISLILGLCAKELIVVSLFLINNCESTIESLVASLINSSSICYFTNKTSIVFLVFIMLYSPCISALSAMKNETNGLFSVKFFIFQMLTAYIGAFIVNLILTINNLFLLLILIFVLVIFIYFMLKFYYKNNNHCRGNCDGCRKIYSKSKIKS